MKAATLGFVGVGFLIGFGIVYNVVSRRAPDVIRAMPLAQRAPEPRGAPAVNVMQVQKLQEKVRSNPRDFDSWVELGNVHFDQRNFADAANAYTKALDLQPDNLDIRTDLGTALFYAERIDDAATQLQTVLSKSPSHPQALFNMGVLKLHGRNDPAGALAEWQKLVDTNPAYPQIEVVKNQIAALQAQLEKK